MQHLEVSCAVRPIVAVRRQMVNLGLDGGEWLASRSVHLTPRQTTLGNRRIGAGWEPEPVFDISG